MAWQKMVWSGVLIGLSEVRCRIRLKSVASRR